MPIYLFIGLVAVFLIVFSSCKDSESKSKQVDDSQTNKDLYGNILPQKYVAGMFNPAKSDLFVELNSIGVKTNGRKHYFRKEAADNLEAMFKKFKSDNPGLELKAISTTRNFYSQKWIWESKWTGKRKVDGMNLARSVTDYEKRGLMILKYSSMPGTSRHHWGTDVDLNSLENSYFEKGDGLVIYNWLLKNAPSFGYYLVYTTGRDGGYNEEKWHWSYMPLASKFYEDWKKFYEEDSKFMLKYGSFKGADKLIKYSYKYVTEINPECKNYGR